jgi:hypothetical protein
MKDKLSMRITEFISVPGERIPMCSFQLLLLNLRLYVVWKKKHSLGTERIVRETEVWIREY